MKTRIFLFILLCFILANINAQNNKDDLSSSKELTGIWEINLGESYETVKAVMQKRGWTASSMPSNEKKAIKNRESLGLDPRPTYTFKKQDGTFGNTKVSKISFSFFQNQLYDIQISFFDINNKYGIESSRLQSDLIEIYSLDFDDKQEFKTMYSIYFQGLKNQFYNAKKEFYHAKNLNTVTFLKLKHESPGTATRFSLKIDIYSKSLNDKVENEVLKEISEDMKKGYELSGIFDSNLGDSKDTVITAMTKRNWIIKNRDRKNNEKIVFTKPNGTYGLWPVYEIELIFENETLESTNVILNPKKALNLEDLLEKSTQHELSLLYLMKQIKEIYNLSFIGEKEYITKTNSSSSESILKYKIFQDSRSNIISFIKCISTVNNNITVYAISISRSLQSDNPEKNDGRLDKIIEDL